MRKCGAGFGYCPSGNTPSLFFAAFCPVWGNAASASAIALRAIRLRFFSPPFAPFGAMRRRLRLLPFGAIRLRFFRRLLPRLGQCGVGFGYCPIGGNTPSRPRMRAAFFAPPCRGRRFESVTKKSRRFCAGFFATARRPIIEAKCRLPNPTNGICTIRSC